MVENLISQFEVAVSSNPWMALVLVFLGGLMTAANPCVIASVPLLIGFLAGREENKSVGRSFVLSLSFTIGLIIMFTGMGLLAALVGFMFGDIGSAWKYIIGAVCLIMGLHLMGVFGFSIPTPGFVKPKFGGILAAGFLGLVFGIVSAPCAAPILVILLTYIASTGNILWGAILLLVYSFAHCILILIAGTSMGAAKTLIESKGVKNFNKWFKRIGGVLIIFVGLYLIILS
ncbi:MAG: cytochrome c biogenesis CcdA family protein [Candidatus Zixiibacteriota bacterium]